MGSFVKPMLLALILCDHTIREEGTQKLSLVGTFNSLFARKFPCVHPSLSVYLALTDGHGKVPCRLRMTSLATDKELFSLPGEIDFKDPNGVAEMVFQLERLRFESSGLYALEFLTRDELLGTRKLQVGRTPPPPVQRGR